MTPLGRTRALVRDLPRVVRTVRHLTPRQILGRLWLRGRLGLYGLVPALAAVALDGPAAPDARGLAAIAAWVTRKYPGARSERQRQLAEEAAAGRFTFLGRSVDVGPGPVDWRPPGTSRLWRYQLHYADYILALALAARETLDARWAARAWALVEDWIAANPPGSRPGWEPYPLSLRLVNWAAALGALSAPLSAQGRVAPVVRSLAAQGRFLARHLEYHLGGNHLIKNAKALIFAGTLVEGLEGAGWRRRGGALLLTELRGQVLPDGGHVERSPLYHAQVLEDMLDCLAVAGGAGTDGAPFTEAELRELGETAGRMTAWLVAMLHPDGGLPLFNDCIVTGEPTPAALLDYAGRLLPLRDHASAPLVALPESGYYVIRSGPGRMVIDCGPVGPDELPAHAHADTLGYELTWGQERVLVDSGTSEYALDDLRRYVRSTAAHNTVVVDGAEQSEVWASFRVGRRARPLGARLLERDGARMFAGAHDGYARLGVIHHRHVFALDGVWVVIDEIHGRGRHRFESLVHVHPTVRAEPSGAGAWLLSGPRSSFRLIPLGPVHTALDRGWYCPDWNRALQAPVVRLVGEAAVPVAFGYVFLPADLDAELQLSADEAGVTLTGRVGGRPVRVRSDRCTFSS
jgi:uncharacterized heparinase superfamily protein